MLRCKEVTTMVASGDLDDAGLWLRMKVRLHLMMCRHCAKYTAQIRAIGSSMRDRFQSPDVEDLQKRILESADRPKK
jgi:anti-sigma factor ChrR (cupin superfamily)